ncbi:type I DNA topoisomerase [Rhodocaloribacter litoris]|uniref:type I DNA topoisomerase n=1 Tax=Rhodocaloribacter litoris TaxID=2558931 RepID=UPI001423B840|nr:type I DNA topoisomerase [Rhodocaloribacter litoris]QXD15696.1 type I DNA topoisomerase [Rhodocaloribacter litoris]
MKRLVVVESPTKARTIRRFLPGNEFEVEASMGHVRDLPASAAEIPERFKQAPWARLGVDVAHDFQPLYVIPPDKKKVVRQLKEALKEADELYIATDEDREGESIGWHLLEVLKPRVPVRRMVFHEITREAILEALEKTRDMDQHLVDAQETRRILDRLFGYTLSPLLWKKIAPRLSAGRVQSVAVRLLVHREKERIAFVPASYWTLKALLEQAGEAFEAQLTHVRGLRIATGRDFDDHTGRLKDGLVPGRDLVLLEEAEARRLAGRLPSGPWRVTNVNARTETRSPYPPFITSTLQQEASRKLGFSARKTMQVAQHLYEQGYITYMRTDSTNLSQEAVEAARRAVAGRYGEEYLSPAPRQFTGKVRNAQEAHEAIRPAGREMKTAEELGLTGPEGALYDLIWKRTVATQMADARLRLVTVTLEAGEGEERATFRASGKTILFPGFFRAYVEGSDDPEAALEDREQPLPDLREGDRPACRRVEPLGRETKPPARYTEATLIKTLEKEGIGRPSTYATIIDTIVERGYVRRQGNQLVPTFTAFATNNLLETQFARLVDVGFTARMEQALDDIASGQRRPVPYLRQFYSGEDGLEKRVEKGLDTIDARQVATIHFPQWGPYKVRVGRYGPYVEYEDGDERVTASLPDDLVPGDVTEETLAELIRKASSQDDGLLGLHPETRRPVFLKEGPYGPYVQLGENDEPGGPKRVSLPKGLAPEEVTLAVAVELLRLPRTLGAHPETGQPVVANIGRYGPYVQHGKTFASLTGDDDVLTVDLDRALELIARKEAKNKPLRELGPHPETGEPVTVWNGRYGPYVKHQRLNASLPDGLDPEALTMEEALRLLEERAASKGKGKKRRSRRA